MKNCDLCELPVEPGQPRFGGQGAGDKSGAPFGFDRHYDCHVAKYGRPDSRPTRELFSDLRQAATILREAVTPAVANAMLTDYRRAHPEIAEAYRKNRRGPINHSPNAGREFQIGETISEMGRKRVSINCPFCTFRFWAYVWSMAGGGKRCPNCGAKHASYGVAYPVEGKEDS